MRKDMAKVIVERPRLGSRANNDDKGALRHRQRAVGNDDLLPRRASTARGRRASSKHFNEHLAPLRRFLNSRVGRHWDKLYAEIRERINPDSTQQMHILQHLLGPFGYVQLDVTAGPGGTFTDHRGKPLHGDWFVNPRTGCLQKNLKSYLHAGKAGSSWYRQRLGTNRPVYVERDGRHFREIEGVWYEVDLRPVRPEVTSYPSPKNAPGFPNIRPDPPVYDAVLHRQPTFKELDDEHGCYCFAAAKRQLGTREIRRYGLRPEPLALPDSPTRR